MGSCVFCRIAVIVAGVAAAFSVEPSLALAAPDAIPAPVVVWRNGPGAVDCPDAAAVRRELAARLRDTPPDRVSASRFDVTVTRTDRGWVADVSELNAAGARLGSRRLTSAAPGCGPTTEGVLFAITLAIDPEAALRKQEPNALAAKVNESGPQEGSVGRGRISALASVGIARGLLPGIAPVLGVSAHYSVADRVRVFVGAKWLPEVSTEDGMYGLSLRAGEIGACWAPLLTTRIEASLCPTALLGQVVATPDRATAASNLGSETWFGISAQADFRWYATGALFAHAYVGGVVPMTRYSLCDERCGGAVYRQGWLAGLIGVGMGVRFP